MGLQCAACEKKKKKNRGRLGKEKNKKGMKLYTLLYHASLAWPLRDLYGLAHTWTAGSFSLSLSLSSVIIKREREREREKMKD